MTSEETPRQRPQPEYGEYAEGFDPESTAETGSGNLTDNSDSTPGNTGYEGAHEVDPGTPAQLTGVPHNLGIGVQQIHSYPESSPQAPVSDAPRTDNLEDSRTSGAPTVISPYQQQNQQNQPPPAPAIAEGQAKPLRADRIFTIVLLGLGALGALNMGASAMNLRGSLVMIARAVDIEPSTFPSSLSVLSAVGAITVLSVYAVTLLFSVYRIRAKKPAFWVPIVGAVLAFISLSIIVGVAVSQIPGLAESITPETLEEILKSATQ